MLSKTQVNVLFKQENSGQVSAMILGLPEYRVEGNDRKSALVKLQELLAKKLEKSEIVSLEIGQIEPEHPWMKFAGIFKEDPDFDTMLEEIEILRRERNQELETYYLEKKN
jgi:hypothetical protein